MQKKGVGICAFSCMFTSLVSLGLAIVMLVIILTGLLQDALDDYVRKVKLKFTVVLYAAVIESCTHYRKQPWSLDTRPMNNG